MDILHGGLLIDLPPDEAQCAAARAAHKRHEEQPAEHQVHEGKHVRRGRALVSLIDVLVSPLGVVACNGQLGYISLWAKSSSNSPKTLTEPQMHVMNSGHNFR